MIATTPSQPKMSKLGRDDNQKSIVVVEKEINDHPILDDDALNDEKPIPKAGDQSETGEYEAFLELGFMVQTIVPLNVVFPDTYFEGEIPQRRNNHIESDNEQPNPRKRKASFSREQMMLKVEVIQPLVVLQLLLSTNAS
ncbi:unnamed protein product [Lactuca saligna]|uniref:Uncharacterized protein n=1 Tax=Lactuca saligna TaxID=75948 RepID=A0AA35ZBX4_LACSI|nr:unnamed protein product [Lactuca saligna]